MNKVLLFTNAERWYDLCPRFNVDEVEWNQRFQNIEKDIIYRSSVNSDNIAILETLPNMSMYSDGVYLVYDSININTLSTLLNQCKQDNLYILTHNTGVGADIINTFDLYCTVLKGAHDGLSKHFYEKAFKILSDDKPDKTNRIIQYVFFHDAAKVFLLGCMVPNNYSKPFIHSCHTLRNTPCLTNIMDDFLVLYKNNHSSPEFENKWKELRDIINELIEKK